MKNKSTLLLCLLFVLVLGGAYVLYGQLSQGQTPDNLVVFAPAASQPADVSQEAPAPQVPADPEPAPAPQEPADPEPAPAPQEPPKETPAPKPEPPVPPAPQPTPEPEATPDPEPAPAPEVTPEPEAPQNPPVEEPREEPAKEPDPNAVYAPDFTVYDKQGNPVRFSDFKGKPIVLNFWASWCGPCKREMPAFDAAYKELGDKVQFLMINATDGYKETLDSAVSFLESTNYTFPVYYDTKLDALNTYGIYAFPTTIFINAEGELVGHAVSALSRELLQTGINRILPAE